LQGFRLPYVFVRAIPKGRAALIAGAGRQHAVYREDGRLENQRRLERQAVIHFIKEVIPLAQPDIVFKHGKCTAAVFSKEVTRGDKTFRVHSVAFQKRYLDKNGEWQTSSYLDVNDLPKATLVLSKAFDYLTSNGFRGEEDEQ
jgi:hypothetical protein